MKYIASNKPLVFLFEEEYQNEKRGILAVQKVLCEHLGFSQEDVKQLVCNYPPVLSKTEDQLHAYFDILKANGVDTETA